MEAISYRPGETKDDLKRTVDALILKRKRINDKMKTLSRMLRERDPIDFDLIDQHQKLNEELRLIKIYEAELCFIKNMI